MHDSELIIEADNGRLAGFRNMFRHENARWWGSGRWLFNAMIWFVLLDMMVISSLYILPLIFSDSLGTLTREETVRQAINIFLAVSRLYLPVGIVILVHDAIIKERELGTMAWIISKPVSRTSFVVSKMAACTAAVMIFMVLVPGLMAYGVISLYNGSPIDPISFFGGLGVMALLCLFYLALTFLLGAVTLSRYAVIGAGVLYFFLGMAASGMLPDIAPYLTWNLPDIARDIALGMPLPSDFILQLIAAVAWAVIMAAVAIRQIQNIEI